MDISVIEGGQVLFNSTIEVGGEWIIYYIINLLLTGYKPLAARIKKEGFKGIKAFFWAELCEASDGTFKVFPGKTAPYQDW